LTCMREGLHGVSRVRNYAVGLLCGLAALLFTAAHAHAADCPPIADKPGAIPHVDYDGVQHLTYCYGPVSVQPGQNLIRLNYTDLFPQVPGYITRFDPDLVYTDGTVPRVDVLHLHHAVWLVNFNPQFAVGEEKSIIQMPQGFGWRSTPDDKWYLNDMIHDLTGKPAEVYIVWRIDFVPDTAPAAASMHTVRTQWMDVAGLSLYPVFDALRAFGNHKRYTFPDQAPISQLSRKGLAQTYVPHHPVTLIGTVGHLHPGGIKTGLRVFRNGKSRRLFQSRAHYYEPAGAVSWDVSMPATPNSWRVILQPNDALSVHTTYDIKRADWYEVMGIMPVAVYDGTDVGGLDAFSKKIPQKGVLTHGHLAENDHHGGGKTKLPDPRLLPNGPDPFQIGIQGYTYQQGSLYLHGAAADPPVIRPGERLTWKNFDAVPTNTYHTITSCREPCNGSTGVAYPIANGPVSFDSKELGFNVGIAGAPAADRDSWTLPARLSQKLKPGTYSYFCRIHPFMRGSFRVIKPKSGLGARG
jgi:plastocyanin